MGLKNTNYVSEKNGLRVANAYALIKNLRIEGEYGEAIFAIHYSREEAMNKPSLETVAIRFKVDRNESPYITAYKKATEKYVTKEIDPETGEEKEVVTGMPFKDWQDDLVTE